MPGSAAVPEGRRKVLAAALTAILGSAAGAVFRASSASARPATGRFPGRNVLVLYYLRTGNTRTVAEHIHGLVGGELMEIRTVEPYPDDYDALVAQNVEEQRTDYKPHCGRRST